MFLTIGKNQRYSLQVQKSKTNCHTIIYQPFHFQLILASVKVGGGHDWKPNTNLFGLPFFYTRHIKSQL